MKKIIAILLAALLLGSFAGCIRISCATPVRYSNADKYTAGEFTYEDAQVKKVEIEWIAGDITLKTGRGTLSVSESSTETISDALRLRWWIDGTTLKIRFCKSGESLPWNDLPKKDLTVELPVSADLDIEIASGKIAGENLLELGKVELETASGGTDIPNLSASEVKLETASGGAVFGNVAVTGTFKTETASGGLTVDAITAKTVIIDSASGGVEIGRVDAETVDLDNASGSVSIGVGNTKQLAVDSTSGKIVLTLLDKEAGAKVKYEAVSGDFNTALSVVNSGEYMTFGNGFTEMNVRIVSGSVTVE